MAGGAANCPGLIGPSEMARWGVVMTFATKELQIKGSWKPMILTETRHPAICLIDFGATSSFWDDPKIRDTLSLLQRSPHLWAFTAGDPDGSTDGEETEKSGESQSEDEDEEALDEQKDKLRLVQALERLETDLTQMPLHQKDDFERQSSTEDWELVQDSDGHDSITSHEFGVQQVEESESGGGSSEEEHEVLLEKGPMKFWSKHQKSNCRHHVRELKEIQAQKKTQMKLPRTLTSPLLRRSRKGPWRVIELFTWTCMISLTAMHSGRWECGSPSVFQIGTCSKTISNSRLSITWQGRIQISLSLPGLAAHGHRFKISATRQRHKE